MATSYMDLGFSDDGPIRAYGERLKTYGDFDLIVTRGLSGTVLASRLAPMFGWNFVIVRKTDDGSHSGSLYEATAEPGQAGTSRWIFLDDFIMSGHTFRCCYRTMRRFYSNSTFVGSAEYYYKRWKWPDHFGIQDITDQEDNALRPPSLTPSSDHSTPIVYDLVAAP